MKKGYQVNPKYAGLAIPAFEKVPRARKSPKRKKPLGTEPVDPRKAVIKEIDREVQQAVRYRDTEDRGGERWGRCVSCRRMLPFHRLQGGHFIKRQYWAFRWDWRNVNAQCDHCNGPSGPPRFGLSGNLVEYRKEMVRRHGEDQVSRWEAMRNAGREPSLVAAEAKLAEVTELVKAKGWRKP